MTGTCPASFIYTQDFFLDTDCYCYVLLLLCLYIRKHTMLLFGFKETLTKCLF